MSDTVPRVEAAWSGLLDALRRAGYAADEMVRPGASEAAIEAAEAAIGRRLPGELRALYAISDGQVDWYALAHGPGSTPDRERGRWVGSVFGAGWTFAPLTGLVQDWAGWQEVRDGSTPEQLRDDFDDVIEVRGADPVLSVYTCADWIAFAVDGGGNALAVDLAPTAGGTPGQVIVIGPDEDLRRVVAPGVVALLQRCRDLLLEGPQRSEAHENGVRLYELEPRGDRPVGTQ